MDVAPPATRRAHVRVRRRTAVLAGGALALLVADVVVQAVTGAFAPATVWSTLVFFVAMAGLVVAGVVVLRHSHSEGTALLLFGTVAAGLSYDLANALQGPGPAAFLVAPIYWVYAALFVHVLLRYPERRVRGVIARIVLGLFYVALPAMTLLWQFAWEARWYGAVARGWWWPTLLPARDFSASTWDAQQFVFVALIAVLVGVVLTRFVAARPAERRGLLPTTLASVILAVTVVLGVLAQLGVPIELDLSVIQGLAVIAVGVGIIVSALLRPATPPVEAPHAAMTVQERYRLALGGGVSVLVLLLIASLVLFRGAPPQAAPAPAPGPALPAPAT